MNNLLKAATRKYSYNKGIKFGFKVIAQTGETPYLLGDQKRPAVFAGVLNPVVFYPNGLIKLSLEKSSEK